MKTARLGLDFKLQIFFVHIGTAFDRIIDIYKINLLLYLNAIISRQVLLISLSQLVYYNTGIKFWTIGAFILLSFNQEINFFLYQSVKQVYKYLSFNPQRGNFCTISKKILTINNCPSFTFLHISIIIQSYSLSYGFNSVKLLSFNPKNYAGK